MTVYHDAISALPVAGNSNKALTRALLIKRFGYCLADSEDLRTVTVIDPDAGTIPLYVVQLRRLFAYDALDSTTAHDGTTCLVSADGKRYKAEDFRIPWAVLSRASTSPPGSPAIDDAYLVPAAATGAWSGKDGQVAVYKAAGWQYVIYPIGKFLYVEDENKFYFRDNGGTWNAGTGASSFSANSIPLSALIGFGLGPVKVENQTTNSPPGSRIGGGTPSVPLGGTSANINDNNPATTSVTSALGDLSAAAVASRIIAKIDFGSNKSLTAIEIKQLKLSAGTGTAGAYYSTDGTSYTKLSTDLSLTSMAQDFVRVGNVTARYIAVILNQANYSTATATTGDLNGYDSTIAASLGTAYIIGPSPYGPWAGNAGKVAICEVVNTFTIYTPATGDEVYNKSLGARVRWNGTSWASSVSGYAKINEASADAQITINTLSPASADYALHESNAPTTSNVRILEALTVSVTADFASQQIDVEYIASVVTASFGANSSFTKFYLVAAVFVDSESSARAWCQVFSFGQASSSSLNSDYLDMLAAINAKMSLVLGDVLPHTLKIVLLPGQNGSGEFPGTSNITLLHRKLLAKQRAA